MYIGVFQVEPPTLERAMARARYIVGELPVEPFLMAYGQWIPGPRHESMFKLTEYLCEPEWISCQDDTVHIHGPRSTKTYGSHLKMHSSVTLKKSHISVKLDRMHWWPIFCDGTVYSGGEALAFFTGNERQQFAKLNKDAAMHVLASPRQVYERGLQSFQHAVTVSRDTPF